MRDGAQWLSNHYAANDYYCEGEKVVGTWVGKGAQIFGIEGRSIEPQDEAFLAIFSGKAPAGEKLKQRASDIIGYDFQCSAQKSVSIMAILGGDDRLFEAHRAAVTQSYQALETLACVQGRDEQGNKRRTTTGVLCSARFEHDTSRALDPHIHTHFATASFSISQAGKRYALETHDMVKAIRYAGKVYQSALRRNVENLGYRTRDKFSDKGQLEGFEIDGISDELCEKYSQRRGEIEEEIAAFKSVYGREPTPAEIHVIAKETRGAKLTEISTQEVRARQRERASADELAQIERVKAQALNARIENHANELDAAELVAMVRDHLAERNATFAEHDVIAEALNRRMGKVSLSELEVAIQADTELVRLDQQKGRRSVVDKTRVGRKRSLAAFAPARFRTCSLASIASRRRFIVRKLGTLNPFRWHCRRISFNRSDKRGFSRCRYTLAIESRTTASTATDNARAVTLRPRLPGSRLETWGRFRNFATSRKTRLREIPSSALAAATSRSVSSGWVVKGRITASRASASAQSSSEADCHCWVVTATKSKQSCVPGSSTAVYDLVQRLLHLNRGLPLGCQRRSEKRINSPV